MARRKTTAILLAFCMLAALIAAAIPAAAADTVWGTAFFEKEFADNSNESLRTGDLPLASRREAEEDRAERLPAPVDKPNGITYYKLWVGGVQVTSENRNNILGSNELSYDPSSKTLTVSESAAIVAPTDEEDPHMGYAVYAESDLTVAGSGVFDFSDSRFGIRTEGNLVIADSLTFRNSKVPLWANKDLTASGIHLNVSAFGIEATGIMAWGSAFITDSVVRIDTYATDSGAWSVGIIAGSLFVTDSSLTIDSSGTCRSFCLSVSKTQVTGTDGLLSVSGSDLKLTSYCEFTDSSPVGQPGVISTTDLRITDHSDVILSGKYNGIICADRSAPNQELKKGSVLIEDSVVSATAEGGYGLWMPAGGTYTVRGTEVELETQGTSGGIGGGDGKYSSPTRLLEPSPEDCITDGSGQIRTISGGIPERITIGTDFYFPVWLGSVRVCRSNMADIPCETENGNARYDPNQRILILENVRSVNGARVFNRSSGDSALISAKNQELRIFSQNSSFVTDDTVSTGIRLDGRWNVLSLEGDKLTVSGKDFAVWSEGGVSVSGTEVDLSGTNGIHIEEGELSVSRGNLTIRCPENAIFVDTGSVNIQDGFVTADASAGGSGCGIYVRDGNVAFVGGTFTAYGPRYGVFAASKPDKGGSNYGNVRIQGARVFLKGGYYGLFGNQSVQIYSSDTSETVVEAYGVQSAIHTYQTLFVSEDLNIALPVGGTLGEYGIMDGSTEAKHVLIGEDVYPVWVGNVQVNCTNMSDVLGDGKVSYSPASGVLKLKDAVLTEPYSTTKSLVYAEGSLVVEGSAILREAPHCYGVTVDGELLIRGADIMGSGLGEGFHVSGPVTVMDSVLDLDVEQDRSSGLWASGPITILSSDITVNAKDGPNSLGEIQSCEGIFSREEVRVNDSVIHITADGQEAEGIAAAGYVSLSGSTGVIKAYGASSSGIRASGNCLIENAQISVYGGAKGINLNNRNTRLTVSGNNCVIAAEGGISAVVCPAMTFESSLCVLEPEGGFFYNGQIVGKGGIEPAVRVLIANASTDVSEFLILPCSGYRISDNGTALVGITALTKYEEFRYNFMNQTFAIYDLNGKKLSDSYKGYIGTGFKAAVLNAKGQIIRQVTVVISGEVTGDGKITALDRLTLSRYLAKWAGYADKIADMRAADIDGDGGVTAHDRLILTRKLAD
ncbi:MAG: hypothetical protein E7576_11255 [Ruminococcaceae bacterium]|nr:hypothetical protein [Oscillospiraceae bacterium]